MTAITIKYPFTVYDLNGKEILKGYMTGRQRDYLETKLESVKGFDIGFSFWLPYIHGYLHVSDHISGIAFGDKENYIHESKNPTDPLSAPKYE